MRNKINKKFSKSIIKFNNLFLNFHFKEEQDPYPFQKMKNKKTKNLTLILKIKKNM
jgi:hypothetical protein